MGLSDAIFSEVISVVYTLAIRGTKIPQRRRIIPKPSLIFKRQYAHEIQVLFLFGNAGTVGSYEPGITGYQLQLPLPDRKSVLVQDDARADLRGVARTL